MADEPTKEQKFSCGCHVVNGVLVAECTQVAPSGEISAASHATAKPFSAKCFRLANIQRFTEQPAVDVPIPSSGEGPEGTAIVTAVDTVNNVVTMEAAATSTE